MRPVLETAGKKLQSETVAPGEVCFLDLALEEGALLTEQGILEQQFRLGANQIESKGARRRGLGQSGPVEVVGEIRRPFLFFAC